MRPSANHSPKKRNLGTHQHADSQGHSCYTDHKHMSNDTHKAAFAFLITTDSALGQFLSFAFADQSAYGQSMTRRKHGPYGQW